MTDGVRVEIQGDASGLEGASGESVSALSALEAIVKQLGAAMAAMGELGLASLERIALGASAARTSLAEFGESAQEARKSLNEISEALIAAFAVEKIIEFGKEMAETAEKTLHTAQTFGLTTDEVQKMTAQAALFGVPADAMTNAMQRLDRSFAAAKQGGTTQANAFRELGINLQGSYTQTQLLSSALQGLSGMAAGPARVAAAIAVFGRNIREIGPLLGITKAQMEEADTAIERYGAVNSEAVAKGVAFAEAVNQNKVAMMGLGNVLTDSLAPVFTVIVQGLNDMIAGFVQSYQSGGQVKELMDGLAVAIKFVESDLVALGAFAVANIQFMIGFGKAAVDAFQGIVAVATGVADIFKALLGPVIAAVGAAAVAWWEDMRASFDALVGFISSGVRIWMGLNADLAGDFSQIATAWKFVEGVVVASVRVMITWIEQLGGAVVHFLESLPGVGAAFSAAGKAFDKAGADMKTTLDNIKTGATAAAAEVKKIWDPAQKAPLPQKGLGTTLGDPDAKAKKESDKGNESDMQALQEKFEQEENSHNEMITNMQADELAYWSQVKTNIQGGALTEADAAKVRTKVEQLRHQLAIEGLQQEIEAIKTGEADQIAAATTTLNAQKVADAERIKSVEDAAKRGVISRQQEAQQVYAIIAQELEQEKAAAAAKYAAAYDADTQIMNLSATNTREYQGAYDDLQRAWQKLQDARVAASASAERQIAAYSQQALDQQKAQWDQSFGKISQDVGRDLLSMAQGTRTFGQVAAQIAGQIEEKFVDVAAKVLSNWVYSMLMQQTAAVGSFTVSTAAAATYHEQATAMSFLTAQKTALNNAVQAATAAYASAASIPLIGWIVAPAAAAAAFAGAEAFGALASAEGGYDIPRGVNPLVQAHSDEMILPARLANPIRDMAAAANFNGSSPANDGAPGGRSGGDQYHFHVGPGGSLAEVQRWFDRNGDALMNTVKTKTRGGRSPGF